MAVRKQGIRLGKSLWGCGVDIFRKPTVNSIGKHTFSAVWISFAWRFAGVIFLFNQVFDMQMHESGY